MNMKYTGWPDSGELVVGEVDEIEDFGVFVDLDEYEDKRGLVHVSEVASGWIKNIRDHVQPDERVVAKVLDVDEGTQQIDLSLKDVNEHQRSEKIQEWKNERQADNWMELAFGEDVDDETYSAVVNALIAEFGGLYDGFEAAAIHGTEALEPADLDDEEVQAIVQVARENVSVPYVEVTGYVDLSCPAGDGVDAVREAMAAATGNVRGNEASASQPEASASDDGEVPEEVELEVSYVGAPEYRITVQAPDYKTAERELETAADRAAASVEAVGGAGEYHRERRIDDE